MDINLDSAINRHQLQDEYRRIRKTSEDLCAPLAIDDYQVQSIAQTSPPKWHIAHMSWLFEIFILSRFESDYQPYDKHYDFIFNSYYYTHGQMHARPNRGLLSRPTVEQVYQYRHNVDKRILRLIDTMAERDWNEASFLITLGLNHEQQHQELLLMDIKHNFFCNPLLPTYRQDLKECDSASRDPRWLDISGGLAEIGHDGNGFAYDNETPRHSVLLRDCRVADRFVTNREYLDFINDDGYAQPRLWLSDGWAWLTRERIRHPLYWIERDDQWFQFTLGGLRELNPHEPVCHVSHYEADAYARWAGKRLPLEAEMEIALAAQSTGGNFMDQDCLHPCPAGADGQWFGDLWGWTSSPYTAYPGFRPLQGSIGEYNGKFMANQMVLKGGSCVTPAGHSRASYRNFFYPEERWAYTGIRLAEDA